MPKQKIAVEQLIEGMEFESDAERTAVIAALSREKNHDAASERYMLRSDYSRQSDALRTKETEAEQKAKNADALKQTLIDWELEEREKFAYIEYLESIGIEPKVGTAPDTTRSATPASPAFDKAALTKELSSQFVTRDAAGPFLIFNSLVPSKLIDIQTKHQALYGKPYEALSALQQEYLDGVGKGEQQLEIGAFEQFVAGKLHFADREKQLAEEALEAKAEKMAQERYEAMVSAQGFPAPSGDMPPSVLLEDQFRQAEGRAELNQPTNNTTLSEFARVNAELERSGVKMYT